VIGDTLGLRQPATGNVAAAAAGRFRQGPRITIVACGTAYYAGLVGKYWIEQLARMPVEVDVASEFRYRAAADAAEGGLALFISQSGETADTLAALRYAKARASDPGDRQRAGKHHRARSDAVLPTKAGPEIGVASTKAFTTSWRLLPASAIAAGRARGAIDAARRGASWRRAARGAGACRRMLNNEPCDRGAGHQIAEARDVLYLGRGTAYPLALEGALKLKEISYIHAEGYAAGEMKHGPIALIDETCR
jgi:glucosamine--fructose-6-phosphate aminotransferase (isomerizing)